MIGTIVIIGASFLLVAMLLHFLAQFSARKSLYTPLFVTVLLFSIGFQLRLLGTQELVDAGFFLTEASHIFATVLFTAALIMGQEKYWNS